MDWLNFIGILKKRAAFITLITLLAVTATSLISVFIVPKQFEASVEMMDVRDPKTGPEYLYQELQAGLELIKDYKAIVKLPIITNQVRKNLALWNPEMANVSNDYISKRIIFESQSDSRVFKITYRDYSPEMAQIICNQIATVLKEKTTELMKSDRIQMVSPAEIQSEPVSPNLPKNIIIAFVGGLMFSILVVILNDFAGSEDIEVRKTTDESIE